MRKGYLVESVKTDINENNKGVPQEAWQRMLNPFLITKLNSIRKCTIFRLRPFRIIVEHKGKK